MQTQATSTHDFRALTGPERFFNAAVGLLAKVGLTPSDYVQLEVVGRRTGKVYATPVNLLELDGRRYLVAPRGHTQWTKNARAAGQVTIRHGRHRQSLVALELPVQARPPLLKAYLERYVSTVQRFFGVRAGAGLAAYAAIAAQHPVFELRAAQ